MTSLLDGNELITQGFNIAVTALFGLVGYVVKSIKDDITKIKTDVHNVELDVSKNYVLRSEHQKSMDRIIDTLERIEDKIDTKMDKR